jgi:hypothetical protein
VSSTKVKIDCRRILLLFNELIIVSDHGRQGFADWFCLSANGFMSATIVFASSPMFLSSRQRQGVFDRGRQGIANSSCLSVNDFMFPTIVFASSAMFLSSRQRQDVSDHGRCFIDHGRDACEHWTSSQTTHKPGQIGWRSAKIVLAVHPWYGEDVAQMQNHGERAVVVEREHDRRIIPVSWTSLIPLVTCQLSYGRPIRISPQAAIDLSHWVSSGLNRNSGGVMA